MIGEALERVLTVDFAPGVKVFVFWTADIDDIRESYGINVKLLFRVPTAYQQEAFLKQIGTNLLTERWIGIEVGKISQGAAEFQPSAHSSSRQTRNLPARGVSFRTRASYDSLCDNPRTGIWIYHRD